VKRLYGIGIGPGDPELITVKAVNLIKHCHCVFVPEKRGKRLAETIASEYLTSKKIIVLQLHRTLDDDNPYKHAAMIIDEALKDEECGVFLTLGDPMVYSTFMYLLPEVKKLNIETFSVPGITSFNAAASVLSLPLAIKNESFYLADGKVEEEVLKNVNTVCILKPYKQKAETLDKLETSGFHYIYVKHCTQPEQIIITDKEEMLQDTDYMSLIFATRIEC
jgi:precorrin-2/cobalt-factor-2 C20-methyltransferase